MATVLSDARSRRLDIQGLRAVAVLMVVAFHAGLPVPGGFVGVDVFFVISGFVITAMLMREWDSTGRIRLGRFYLRRFKRLTPALAVTVGVVMVASVLLLSPLGGQQTAAKTAVGAMLLAANLVIARTSGGYFDAPAESNPLLNTWSLSVEEQFYLVFPAVLLVGWLLGRRARRPWFAPAAMVGLVGAVSFGLAVTGSFGFVIPRVPDLFLGFYSPATRAWEFAVGALIALGGAKLTLSRRVALPGALAGTSMLTVSLWLITEKTPFPGLWTLLPVFGTVALLAAGSRDTVVSRILASRPMVAIGDRSYSIYLWHWPFIVFAQLLWPGSRVAVLAAAALSLIPAYGSYRWIEQPVRALPLQGAVPLMKLVAAFVVTPIALAGALGYAAQNGFWNRSVRSYQAAILTAHAGVAAGCAEGAWRHPALCNLSGQTSGQPIYLVGDSNADQFSEALIGAASTQSRPLVGLSKNACPYLPVSFGKVGVNRQWESRCRAYPGDTEDYLLTAERGLVVIANSYVWFQDNSGIAVGAPDDIPSHDPEVKLGALSSGLSGAVRSLQDAGHSVLLVQAVPHWGAKESLSWATCSVLDVAADRCTRTMQMVEVQDRQGAVADVVAAVAVETGADVLDVSSELCPNGTCASVAPDGVVRYRDGTHITVPQSWALTPTFESAIAAAG